MYKRTAYSLYNSAIGNGPCRICASLRPIRYWLNPNRATISSHTLYTADTYLYYVNLLGLGSRSQRAHSPSLLLAGTGIICCIAIFLSPQYVSRCFLEVGLPLLSIPNTNRGLGESEYLRSHDPMPFLPQTSAYRRTCPNPFDLHPRCTFDGSSELLHHAYYCTIRLRSLDHCSSFFLSWDLAK